MDYSEEALQKVREDRLLIDEVDRWLFDEISPYIGQRVLEVGCGLGNFARFLEDRKLYVGTDVNVRSVEYVQKLFSENPNVLAIQADVIAESFLDLKRFKVDTVFSLNVFEHIADDLLATQNSMQILKPNGTLILVVPAHEWLYGSIDRTIGHYRRYDKTMINELCNQAGLELLTIKHINALGAVGWYANGRIRKQNTPPARQLRLINRIVPYLKRIEQIVPMPFGISMLAVARKP
jgi:SAM-dependent methyltransferase